MCFLIIHCLTGAKPGPGPDQQPVPAREKPVGPYSGETAYSPCTGALPSVSMLACISHVPSATVRRSIPKPRAARRRVQPSVTLCGTACCSKETSDTLREDTGRYLPQCKPHQLCNSATLALTRPRCTPSAHLVGRVGQRQGSARLKPAPVAVCCVCATAITARGVPESRSR